MTRAIVFIDGSNFYHRLKYLTTGYVGTADSQSFGLSKVTGNYLILRPEDIEPFFPKNK